jgi:hypothetical protein
MCTPLLATLDHLFKELIMGFQRYTYNNTLMNFLIDLIEGIGVMKCLIGYSEHVLKRQKCHFLR